MTDLELAMPFFKRLEQRGVKIVFDDEAYGIKGEHMIIGVCDGSGEPAWEFDFHTDGSFYRLSGYCKDGNQDEIDYNKYPNE